MSDLNAGFGSYISPRKSSINSLPHASVFSALLMTVMLAIASSCFSSSFEAELLMPVGTDSTLVSTYWYLMLGGMDLDSMLVDTDSILAGTDSMLCHDSCLV